eukprot:s948_g12.t1
MQFASQWSEVRTWFTFVLRTWVHEAAAGSGMGELTWAGVEGVHQGDVSAAVGTELKRGPELEQSGSTKLQAISSVSGSIQKQWTEPPGQAGPSAAPSSANMSKTDNASKFSYDQCTENSISTMESPSSFRDAPTYFY